MKRNKFGINIDEGIALETSEEFNQLYVDVASVAEKQLSTWLQHGKKSVLFGGQIGCGKTTLIEYVFQNTKVRPDLTFHFDRKSLNLSSIDSWLIIFCEIFKKYAELNILDAKGIPVNIKKILGNSQTDWLESISQVQIETFSQEAIEKNKLFKQELNELQDYLEKLFEELINDLENHKEGSFILFASGVDKFETDSAGYFALKDILYLLSSYKTLFEVNSIHLFSGEIWSKNLENIIITASNPQQIEQILTKRMGKYTKAHIKTISVISNMSGGIPRQAIRMLDYYLSIQKKYKDKKAALQEVFDFCNQDFFAYSQQPSSALLQNIDKKHYLETNLISLPGDKETARRSIFGNWIIIKSHIKNGQWNVITNPLLKTTLYKDNQNQPESKLLQKYAEQTGISGFGLDGNIDLHGWQNILTELLETPIVLNITEILDLISSSLLSKDRADRIIIAYENNQIADIVRSYLIAKSNSYEYQTWDHYNLNNQSHLIEMIEQFNDDSIDIFSFNFPQNIKKKDLEELNARRDYFIDKQMIWWIPKQELKNYLGAWTQLRQLFQIYILDEELARSLKIDEIESDINFMKDLIEEENTSFSIYVDNLIIVLEYLRGRV